MEWIYVVVLVAVLIVTFLLQRATASSHSKVEGVDSPQSKDFRYLYLCGFLLMTASDWFKMPFQYQQYTAAGFNLSDQALFNILHWSSALLLGTVLSSSADQYGRKRLAMLYGLIDVSVCLLRLTGRWWPVALSHVGSGVQFVLLGSVFESWLVHEHHHRKFPEAGLGRTLTYAAAFNGLLAISIGVFGNAVVWALGLWWPLVLAAMCSGSGLTLIGLRWSENYGEAKVSLFGALATAARQISNDRQVLRVGMAGCMYEVALFSFVLLFAPAFESTGAAPPMGLLFSTFLACATVGSFTGALAGLSKQLTATGGAALTSVALVALYLSAEAGSGWMLYTSCLLFEFSVGFFFPAIAGLRGDILPHSSRSSIISIFRVPQCLLLVIILYIIPKAGNSVFLIASLMAAISSSLCLSFVFSGVRNIRTTEAQKNQ